MAKEEKRIFTWALILALMLLLAFGCNKDDGPLPPKPDVIDIPDPKLDPENQAPNSFLLLTPETDSTLVNRTPTFSWEQATDPDGDSVTYDLYLDTQENPGTLVAENLGTTSFKLTENLAFETQFYWKVVAKDNLNGETESDIKSFVVNSKMLFLTEYKKETNNSSSNTGAVFSYQNSVIDAYYLNTNKYDLTLEMSPQRLSRVINIDFDHTYTYNVSAQQERVKSKQDIAATSDYLFEYDQSQRLVSISEERAAGGMGSNSLSTFKYVDDLSILPYEILTETTSASCSCSSKNTLIWEHGNLISETIEIDTNDGKGYQYFWHTILSYDDNINPYHRLITRQFGFDVFFVHDIEGTGLTTYNFGPLKWQSTNNLVKLERYKTPNTTDLITKEEYDYVYTADYYPKTANVKITNGKGEITIQELSWSYLSKVN